jgi:hypothetical protein
MQSACTIFATARHSANKKEMSTPRDVLLKAVKHNLSVDPLDKSEPVYAIDEQTWIDYDIGADGKPTNRVVHKKYVLVPVYPRK